MSTENGESAPWRRSVEVRLAMLEAAGELYQEGLTEQRAVTTAMDADVSSVQNDFRKQRGLLQAIRQIQHDHTATLRRLTVGRQEDWQDRQQRHAQVLAHFNTVIGLLRENAGGAKPSEASGAPK